ncbi:hypothetical protein WR25_08936 [Diploscapter pachys]|uniref:Tyrosine-protein phosphatase domain-containing protein n=1 Tax=Diploscapter pachys TaxID=2018661 RepID=A0A2A2LSE2_9BILA|nr:hypothetical protein WR25_08936 [Diploscapter pachys]
MRCKFTRGRIRVAPNRGEPIFQLDIFCPQKETCDRLQHYKILEHFVEETTKKGIEGLIKEYRKMDGIHDNTETCDAFKVNMLKNRYSDVVCLDRTRVKLKLAANQLGDYIHANYIDIDSKLLENKFICTQGPLFSTIDDFWRMIFQERIATILMLCKPVEDGRPKCNVYWPENTEDSKEVDSVLKVTNLSEASDETGKSIQLKVELHPDYGMQTWSNKILR